MAGCECRIALWQYFVHVHANPALAQHPGLRDTSDDHLKSRDDRPGHPQRAKSSKSSIFEHRRLGFDEDNNPKTLLRSIHVDSTVSWLVGAL